MNFIKVIFLACSGSALLCAGAHQDVDAIRLLAANPVHFEPAEAPGRFVARGLRYRFEFEKNRASLRAGNSSGSLQFEGANPRTTLQGIDRLASKTTSFKGNDRSKWRDNIPNFNRLEARALYQGIDLIYYGTARDLEYDLKVRPGADPRQIRLRFEGSDVTRKQPVAYQLAADGHRVMVQSGYRKNSDGSVGFALGAYDRKRELVIDPVLTFSVYIAGTGSDVASAIGHDSQGRLYIGGTTSSTDLPVPGNPIQSATGGENDAFIAVLDPTQPLGSQVIYTTYFGGSGEEQLTDMVVTGNGVVFATGSTDSDDFPTANPYQSTLGGITDAFVFKIIPSQGTSGLYYSTYLGGASADTGSGIAVDAAQKIYVVGTTQSAAFPVVNAYEGTLAGTQDAFIAVIDPSQSETSTLVYSTFMGGTLENSGQAIALAPDGTIWAVGGTYSSDFPISGYCYRYTYYAGGDAFAVHVNPSLGTNGLLYGTYLGGTGEEEAKKVVVDSKGRVIMTGYTTSVDLPVTSNALQSVYGGGTDAFVAILDPSIQTANRSDQLVYSTYFGGSYEDVPYSLREDTSGNLYVSGFTASPDMTVTGDALDGTYDNSLDAFILIFNPTQPAADGPIFSTFLGSGGVGVQTATGIDVDSKGMVYVTGYTTGGLFDQLNGPQNSKENGQSSTFVLGFQPTSSASAREKNHRQSK